MQGLSVVIVAIFFATSSDSASLVVDMLCTGSSDSGPVRQRMFWGISEGALAASLIILAGDAGLEALQEVITVIGLPIFLMVFAMMFSLMRGLQSETLASPAGRAALPQTDPTPLTDLGRARRAEPEPRPAPPKEGSSTEPQEPT